MKVIIATIPDDQPDLRASLGIEINEAQMEINDIERRMDKAFEKQFKKEEIYDLCD